MRFLTFDLGTTLFKVGLLDDRGNLLDIQRVSPPVERPRPCAWELRRDFLGTLYQAVRRLSDRAGAAWSDVAAVSFATQANSFTLLDELRRPLMPLVLWPDQRDAHLASALSEISELPGFRQATGMPRFGPLLALAKFQRPLRRHKTIQRAHGFCFISDLLAMALTGKLCTEAGVAGLSGACDVRRLEWWPPVLEKLNLSREWLPPIVRAGIDIGPLLPDVARTLKLSPSCRFVVGCLDQYAGAIGTETVTPGAFCETTGTVLAAVRYSDHFAENAAPDVFQGPSFHPGHYFQMSFSSTSANLLDHYRAQLEQPASFEQLTQEAIDAAPSDLVIHPFRDSIDQSFRDARPHHTRGQIVRAIMQCVAHQLHKQVRDIAGAQRPGEIRCAGGAARNDYWLQMKANTLRIPVVAMQCEEPTSLGAAILAASGIGLGDVPTLAQKWVKVRKRFDPR